VVVFYVAIVLLLIGTNLRAGRAGRSARFKKHVVEYSEDSGRAENRLVPQKESRRGSGGGGGEGGGGETGGGGGRGGMFEYGDDEAVEV
jgi:hypothetical protein